MRQSSNTVLIAAGSLRHQVQVQQQTTAATLTGSPQASWSTIRTTRARITAIKQTEDFQQAEFSGQATHNITVRWTPTPEIFGGMRIIYRQGGRPPHTYLVQTVVNVDLRNIRIDMMCLEIEGGQ